MEKGMSATHPLSHLNENQGLRRWQRVASRLALSAYLACAGLRCQPSLT